MVRGTVYCFLAGSLWLGTGQVHGQEGLGAALDNYAPVNGMLLNPSAIVDQRPWLDVHIAGFGAHVSNNITYVNDSRLVNFSRLQDVSFNAGRGNGWGQVDAEVLGPSASLSMGDYAVGFHVSGRYIGSAKQVPVGLAQVFLEKPLSVSDSLHRVEKMGLKTLGWAEIGITYGQVLYRFDRHFLMGGATLNRLMGLQSAALFVKEGNAGILNEEAYIGNAEGKYAYAGPGFTVGGGWSGSIGITYKRMLDDVGGYVPHSPNAFCQTFPYRYKIMLSLIDIGGIRMKRNALANKFGKEDDAAAFARNAAFSEIGNASGIPRDRTKFTASTPMAMNLQYEYNFNRGLFLNAFLLQRISLPSFLGPGRANLLAVTPRYEKADFSVSLPVSLLNYRKPQVGLAFRLAFFTLGTEHILPYLFESDLYSADIYFHLRIRFMKPPNCLERPAGNEESFWLFNWFRKKDNDPAACPEW